MCTRQECLNLLREAAPLIHTEFGVKSLRLFGSMARGDNHKGSDVDICVEMPPKAFTVLSLKNYLQELLHTNVDLIRINRNLDPFLLTEINRDGINII